MTIAQRTAAGSSSIDWRTALRHYRDLLEPILLVGGHLDHQSRLRRLLNAKWKGRNCCLAYIRTH